MVRQKVERLGRAVGLGAGRSAAAIILTGLLASGAMAAAQSAVPSNSAPGKTMPDAQVESNVLKAMAGAPDLANQAIKTTTVYGVVTLTGSVETEALRVEAETIVSRTAGVQKVVDEMTLGPQNAGDATQPMLQPDGTMAPAQGAPVQQGSPDSDNTAPMNGQSPNMAAGPAYGPGAPEYRQPYNAPQQAQGQQQYPGGYGPPADYGQQQGSPQQQQAQNYPQQQGYPQQPQQGYAAPPQGYPQQAYNNPPPPVYGGQEAGVTVTVPSGAMLRMRINQTLDSSRNKPGDRFDGVVVNDLVADGAVAIPRGASVQGVVVDAKKSGALVGRGELSLQLTQVTMGGKTYPIISDVWAQHGGDKTAQTVNNTAVGGGIGALIGAVAGGGAGAAIGAGVGGAVGLGASAASGRGQVFVPSEGLLTFHLTQPATVATVSQAEMDRLAQGVPAAAGAPPLQRRYPPGYYGPAYPRPYPYPY